MKKSVALILFLILGLWVNPLLAAAPPAFVIPPDNNKNFNTLTLTADTYVDDIVATTVAQSITVPRGASFVNFSGAAAFYVNFTTTATVPGANITGGTGSILSPGCRAINGITSFSIIAPASCVVSLEWYH